MHGSGKDVDVAELEAPVRRLGNLAHPFLRELASHLGPLIVAVGECVAVREALHIERFAVGYRHHLVGRIEVDSIVEAVHSRGRLEGCGLPRGCGFELKEKPPEHEGESDDARDAEGDAGRPLAGRSGEGKLLHGWPPSGAIP